MRERRQDLILILKKEEIMSQPIRAADSPFAVEVEAGKSYYWCACGASKAQPLCDGSHRGTGFTPLKLEAKENETVYLCGCKATGNPPFCDGSHKK
jgi:CDGSH-type Zn-finger protein